MELKITKEKVLEAAAKCSQAKETLKTLFPEVFEQNVLRFNKSQNEPGYVYNNEDVLWLNGEGKIIIDTKNYTFDIKQRGYGGCSELVINLK